MHRRALGEYLALHLARRPWAIPPLELERLLAAFFYTESMKPAMPTPSCTPRKGSSSR